MKTISSAGLDIIKDFEGLRLTAYLDSVDIPTIGYGIIMYPDGEKVKMGDTCTKEEAELWLKNEVNLKTNGIYKLIDTDTLSQPQFDALVSFAYNVGVGALKSSTLLKKAKADPNDPTIKDEFLKWNRAGNRVLFGLTRRRQAEADLYFS